MTLDKTNADLLANYAKVSGFKNASLISGNNYSFTPDEKGTGITIDGMRNWAGNPHDCTGLTFKQTEDTAAVESTATLKNGKYTTAGIKTTGYKLANNKISYLTKNIETITSSGLASGAKASGITVDGKKITLGKNAIPTNGTAVSVKTSGYTLATNGLSEVIISDKGTAKKADYYFATSGTLPTGYVKTKDSDKKTYYVQKDAKFNQAYAEYGIKVRVVEGKTTTYMTAAPSGYTQVIDAKGTFYTNAITMNSALTNAAASGKKSRTHCG